MILISTHDKTSELQEGETLLKGLGYAGHRAEYQHRSGYCGSCRIKILDGRVSYGDLPLVSITPGGILPYYCRVHKDVKVNYRGRVSEPDLFDVNLFDKQD